MTEYCRSLIETFYFIGIRINVSLSINDILSLKTMLACGGLFTAPSKREQVQKIFNRFVPGLKKLGIEQDAVERMITLL